MYLKDHDWFLYTHCIWQRVRHRGSGTTERLPALPAWMTDRDHPLGLDTLNRRTHGLRNEGRCTQHTHHTSELGVKVQRQAQSKAQAARQSPQPAKKEPPGNTVMVASAHDNEQFQDAAHAT